MFFAVNWTYLKELFLCAKWKWISAKRFNVVEGIRGECAIIIQTLQKWREIREDRLCSSGGKFTEVIQDTCICGHEFRWEFLITMCEVN